MQDLEDYDKKCKVEPLQRAMKEANTDAWINGRRRDHGAERASLPVWEGNKVNLLTHWSFEECWNYLRKYNVPYHPLHDVGFSSLGDVQVARPPPRPAPPRRAPPPPPPSTRLPPPAEHQEGAAREVDDLRRRALGPLRGHEGEGRLVEDRVRHPLVRRQRQVELSLGDGLS